MLNPAALAQIWHKITEQNVKENRVAKWYRNRNNMGTKIYLEQPLKHPEEEADYV